MFDDLNAIRWFAAIANAGSLTRASQVLDMPLPSLSRRLVEIEESVGERLIHRSARKFELTELGSDYLQHATQLLEQIDLSQEQLKNNEKSIKGTVTLTAPIDFASLFLADVLKRFNQIYPEVDIRLNLATHHLGFDSEHLDVAIRFGQLRDSSIICKRLGDVHRGIYGNTKKMPSIKRLKHPKDLAEVPFVMLSPHSASPSVQEIKLTHTTTDKACVVNIKPVVQANVLGMVAQLAVAGNGVAMLPTMIAEHEMFQPELQRLLPDWQLSPLEMFLLYRKKALQPKRVQVMIEHLTQHFSSMTQIKK